MTNIDIWTPIHFLWGAALRTITNDRKTAAAIIVGFEVAESLFRRSNWNLGGFTESESLSNTIVDIVIGYIGFEVMRAVAPLTKKISSRNYKKRFIR